MSLTRAQWVEMWDDLKLLENKIEFATELRVPQRALMLNLLAAVKRKIESVLGPMG